MSETCPKSERSPKFHRRMDQAMGMSFHKYGPVKNAFPHKVNALQSLEHRLQLYRETGNQDYLVDVANFAMIEFMCPDHEEAHDTPTDGGEGRRWNKGPTRENDNENVRQSAKAKTTS